jgi:hypothetical protein
MKKTLSHKRALVLNKETIHTLATNDLKAVAGGAPTIGAECQLTIKTCASFEFSC